LNWRESTSGSARFQVLACLLGVLTTTCLLINKQTDTQATGIRPRQRHLTRQQPHPTSSLCRGLSLLREPTQPSKTPIHILAFLTTSARFAAQASPLSPTSKPLTYHAHNPHTQATRERERERERDRAVACLFVFPVIICLRRPPPPLVVDQASCPSSAA